MCLAGLDRKGISQAATKRFCSTPAEDRHVAKLTINGPVKVFYSYSHKDAALRDGVATSLAAIRRQGYISEWHDRCIEAGDYWKTRIDENLNRADIVLLLISPDFIASDYCWSVEAQRALERHHCGDTVAIPIILRPSLWQVPLLAGLQALPTSGKPITTWGRRDDAFLDIATGIRRRIIELLPKPDIDGPDGPGGGVAVRAPPQVATTYTVTVSGTASPEEIEAILAHLREFDPHIRLHRAEPGSTKLVLSGSANGRALIARAVEYGLLVELEGHQVISVRRGHPMDGNVAPTQTSPTESDRSAPTVPVVSKRDKGLVKDGLDALGAADRVPVVSERDEGLVESDETKYIYEAPPPPRDPSTYPDYVKVNFPFGFFRAIPPLPNFRLPAAGRNWVDDLTDSLRKLPHANSSFSRDWLQDFELVAGKLNADILWLDRLALPGAETMISRSIEYCERSYGIDERALLRRVKSLERQIAADFWLDTGALASLAYFWDVVDKQQGEYSRARLSELEFALEAIMLRDGFNSR